MIEVGPERALQRVHIAGESSLDEPTSSEIEDWATVFAIATEW